MKSNNIFKSFAALVLGCALFVNSCQGTKEESENKKPVEPVFPAMVEDYNVVHGSTLTLNFEVNMDWTLTISDSNMRWFWIEDNSFKVDKISGKVATNGVPESVTVHIGVSDTEEFDNNRECTLTLTMGGKSQDVAKYMRPAKSRTIAVKVAKVENGAFVKDASGAYVYEETEAQTMTLLWSEEDADFRMPVEVNANFEWTVSAPEWLKFQEPDKTSGVVELVFTAMSVKEVSGKVAFMPKGSDSELKNIGVTAPSCGELDVYAVVLDENGEFLFTEDGGYLYSENPVDALSLVWMGSDFRMPVRIESKCNWTVELPQWLTIQYPEDVVDNTRGTICCTLLGNPKYYPLEDSTADMVFKFGEETLKSTAVTIPGVQDLFSYGIEMGLASWEFNAAAELMTTVGYQELDASAYITGTKDACVVAVEMKDGRRVTDNPDWLKISVDPYVTGEDVLQTRSVIVRPDKNEGENREAVVLFIDKAYKADDWFTADGNLTETAQKHAVTLLQHGLDMDYVTMIASESELASAGATFDVNTNPRLDTYFGSTKYKYDLTYSNIYARDNAYMSLAKPYASFKIFDAARKDKTSDTGFWLRFTGDEKKTTGVVDMYFGEGQTPPTEGKFEGYVVFYDTDLSVLAIIHCIYNPVVVVEEVVVEFTEESAQYAQMVGATLEKLVDGPVFEAYYDGMSTIYHLTYKMEAMQLKIRIPASIKKHDVNPVAYKSSFKVNNLVYDESFGPEDILGEVELDDQGAVEVYMNRPETVVPPEGLTLPENVYVANINFRNRADELVFILVCTLDLSE